jgi:hypothetical protein
MGDPARLELRLRARGRADFSVTAPLSELVVTSFVPASEPSAVPTLASVERVNGLLAQMELALADRSALTAIAQLLTQHYVLVPQARWEDGLLDLDVVAPAGDEERAGLTAVDAVRTPILTAAPEIERCEDPLERHTAEAALADRIISVARGHAVRRSLGASATFFSRTVLETLVAQLVGIPLSNILRAAASDAFRRIGR